jgi:hypothetical protein
MPGGRPRTHVGPPDPEIQRAILTHVRAYPGLSSYEIARAIGLKDPKGWGRTRTHRILELMLAGNLVSRKVGPRGERDSRPAAKWFPA